MAETEKEARRSSSASPTSHASVSLNSISEFLYVNDEKVLSFLVRSRRIGKLANFVLSNMMATATYLPILWP